jgi:hypothetical protein
MKWVPNPGPQTEAYFSPADEIFFGGQAGGGKLLCNQTLIPVPLSVDISGFKKHGDLLPGDFVFTAAGETTQILARTEEILSVNSYTVEFDTGEKVRADGEHLWNTLTDYDRDRILRSSEEWRAKRKASRPSRAKEVSKKPGVSADITLRNQQKVYDIAPIVATPKTTRELSETLLAKKGRTNHSVEVAEPLQGVEVDLPIEPYLFGLWIGDGFSSAPTIGMLKDDWEVIGKFVPPPYNTYTRNRPGTRTFDALSFTGLSAALKDLGVHGSKRIPPTYLRANIAQRTALLQGIMDTDGTCDKRGQLECGFSNELLAGDLLELVSSLGIKATLRRKETHSQNGPAKDHFRIKFMCGFPAFRLPRKLVRQKLDDFRDTIKRRYITSVTPAEPTRMRCIKVADPSGLYLVGRTMIPTHNSDLEIGLAINEHDRSLLLRRTNKEADGLADRMTEILGTRDGYNSQKGTWRIPHNGNIVEIGGCQLETDKQRYKGNPHSLICVGRETPVLMADGSYRNISNIYIGDLVATLEGPRKVLKSFPVGVKPSVALSVRLPCGAVHRQVQSTTHKVLSRKEWVAPGTQGVSRGRLSVLASTQSCVPLKSFSKLVPLSELVSRVLNKICGSGRSTSRLPQAASVPVNMKGQQVSCACTVQALHQNANVKSGVRHLDSPQRPLYCPSFLTPLPPLKLSGMLSFLRSVVLNGGYDALKKSSLLGSQVCYQFLSRFCGERILLQKVSCFALKVVRPYPLPQVDVGEQNPTHSQKHGKEKIHARNPHTTQYAHPYTKEIRQTECDLSLVSWSAVPIGDVELFDIEVEEVNHFITKGGIVNKNCFDEVSDFTESQYVFINAWNRSANPKQRCRIVAAGNPPTRPEGLWVVRRWAAWLDPKYANPASPGELRWYTTGEDGKEVEVDGRGPHSIYGEQVFARSRTFIPSQLSDNPDLSATNYAASLAGLPEELRLAYRDGDFSVGLRDEPWQIIPSAWVVEAQARWTKNPPFGVPMCCIGVDVAQGGNDNTVLAIRHDGWFAPLIVIPGAETKDGPSVAGKVVANRRDECRVVVDIGGGWGGEAYAHMKANGMDAVGYMGIKASTRRTRDRQLAFTNVRTEAYWRFREALDPAQPGGSNIKLPSDPEIVSDLCAAMYEVTSRGIKLESKEDVCKKLSRSPDKGDAIVMAWWDGYKVEQLQGGDWKGVKGGRMTPKVIMGRAAARMNKRR